MAEILVGEAAKILNCSTTMVHYLERTGQLVGRRIGHVRVFQQDDVERLRIERLRIQLGMPELME